MKQTALITGATSGIGFELADLLAANGHDVILVARDQKRLEERARSFSEKYQARVKIIARDLADPSSPRAIFDEATAGGTMVSILVNNAGFGVYGSFAENALDSELAMMQVNMNALVHLTKLFVKPMIDRREGRILNVASTVAFQPGPGLALYSASKAFVHSFSCALSVELAQTGVVVTSLCPGGTATEFQKRAGMERAGTFNAGGLKPMSARAVAEEGYRAMMQGRPAVVAGWKNKCMVAISRRLPMMWPARIAARVNHDR